MEFATSLLSLKTFRMATILPPPTYKSKAKLHSVKVDMTPMVDLGFLLITFFIFTTTVSQPTVTKLSMPAKDQGTIEIAKSKLLTILVDKEKVFVYDGAWTDAAATNRIRKSTYNVKDGVGNFIRQRQLLLGIERDELMVAIKPVSTASYQDVMNALDEMHLNNVKRYGIMQITEPEKNFLLNIAN